MPGAYHRLLRLPRPPSSPPLSISMRLPPCLPIVRCSAGSSGVFLYLLGLLNRTKPAQMQQ